MKLTHIDLFSGIGGFALAARWAGIETVQFVEIDKFCQKVLKKHWPGVPIHDDITTFDGTKYSNVFLLTGGFPCQPFSCAGKRRGKEDDRYLWPEMLRIIQEVRPRWIIGENVAGFINMGLDDSISDLEREGYEVQPFIIPACAVNAPHRRDRVWIVAHSTSGGCLNGCGDREERHFQDAVIGEIEENKSERDRWLNRIEQTDCPTPNAERLRQQPIAKSIRPDNGNKWEENWYTVALRTCVRRVDDGLSRQVDRVNRLKALGNAVVPQIPFLIMTGILDLYIVGQPLP